MIIRTLPTNDFDLMSHSIDIENSICLVIDVIRATSTITTILAGGAERVIISPDKEMAFRLKEINNEFILCGEENCITIKGFDYNNSPTSFLESDIREKTVVLKTTNGTKSFIKSNGSTGAYALSILNLNYATETALKHAVKNQSGLLYICSGKSGEIAYDDIFTAGLSIKYLSTRVKNLELDDASHLAFNSALQENHIYKALMKSNSAKFAYDAGFDNDIRFCADLNKYKNCGKLEKYNIKGFPQTLYTIKAYLK